MFPNFSNNTYKNGYQQGYNYGKSQSQQNLNQNYNQNNGGYYDNNGNYYYDNTYQNGYYDENGNYYDNNGNNQQYYQQQPQQINPQQQQQIKPKKPLPPKKIINIGDNVSINIGNNDNNNKPWECAVCTYVNEAHRQACGMCGLAKTVSAQQQEWQCHKCTFMNNGNSNICSVCGAKRIKLQSMNYDDYTGNNGGLKSPVYNPIPKMKPMKVQLSANVTWCCSVCTLENLATVLRCEACGTARGADNIGANYDDESQVDDVDDYQDLLRARKKKQNKFPNNKGSVNIETYGNKKQKGYWNEYNTKEYIQGTAQKFKQFNVNGNSDKKLKSSVEDFRRAASDISCYNEINPSGVFSTLRSVSKKLLKDDVRYRTLDTTNPKVMERLIGYEGVIDFLMLLGFEADAMGMKLVCHQKPPPEVVRNAINVLDGYENRLGLGKKKKHKGNNSSTDVNYGSTPMGGNGGNISSIDNERKDDGQDTLTLEQIIMWSTHETMRDAETMETLIMTHKSFTDSVTLLRHLKKRFFLPMPVDIKKDKQKIIEWRSKVQRNVDLKVINSLKHWMKQFWFQDFNNNLKLQKELKYFIKQMENETTIETKWMGVLAKTLNDELNRYINNTKNGTLINDELIDDMKERYNDIIKPKKFRIENLNPEDLSDQITLMDFSLFSKIKPRECLNQAWKKKGNKTNAPNILAMIRQFNNLTVYIQISILKERTLKERSKTMRRIIKIGERFREQKNYNSLCAVFSALNSAPIHRLKLAWKRVPERHIQMFEQFKVIFKRDFNHRNLRQLFRNAAAPSIPHIGLFLQDLVFIDDGNSSHKVNENFVQHGKMVNFSKSVRLFDRIKNIRLYQQHPYTKIKENLIVQKMLLDEFERLKDVTEDQIWDMSTEIKKNDERDAKKWGI